MVVKSAPTFYRRIYHSYKRLRDTSNRLSRIATILQPRMDEVVKSVDPRDEMGFRGLGNISTLVGGFTF